MNRLTTICIIFLFILSGITSLVYQTLWIRVISLGVGSTSASISMVLSIFFLGLSLGSYLTGRWIHRINNHLLFYGLLEGVIGIYSLSIISILFRFHEILAVLPLSGSLSWFGIAFKFFLIFLVLIFPTILMGSSLPVLIRIFVTDDKNMGKWISFLYGINTLGAAAGAFLAGFAFIPNFGIDWSNHIMVILNFIIFGFCYLISRDKGPVFKPESLELLKTEDQIVKENKLNRYQKIILIACTACGFTSISSEVVWSKYLGIFFGTNIFGLGLILSLYLLGIAIGSIILSAFIDKIKNKTSLFVNLFLLSILSTICASFLLNLAPTITNIITYYLGDMVSVLVIKSLLTFAILFIPTSLFGTLLPLGIHILNVSSLSAPATVGRAYALNTVGSILGSYLAGIVLIPTIGSSNTLKVSIFVMLATGILLIYSEPKKIAYKKIRTGIFVSVFFSLFFTQNIDFRNIIKSAYFQASNTGLTFREIMKYFAHEYEEFKFIAEGKTGIISLSHDQQDGENYKRYLRLKTNGLNESIYNLDALHILPKYESLLGLLPYVFQRSPKKAFIVGYGGGYTVDFLTSLDLKKIYVAELEEGILKAADFVYGGENPILKRKNLDVEVEDARYVLAANLHGKYDIIVSQPSHSWLSGVANLFTQDFFHIVKGSLNNDGIFSQWLNLYNMNRDVLKSILKTFYTVFPHGAVFTDFGDQELIMLGSLQPLAVNLDKINAMTRNKMLNERLSMVPFNSEWDFLTNFSYSREDILELSKDAPLNTDRNAFAEVNQSRLFYSYDESDNPELFLEENYKGDFSAHFNNGEEKTAEFFYQLLSSLEQQRKYAKFHQVMKQYEERYGDNPQEAANIGYLALQVQRYHTAEKSLRQSLNYKPTTTALNLLLNTLTTTKKYDEALKLYQNHRKLADKTTDCYLADIYLEINKQKSSEEIFKKFYQGPQQYASHCGSFYNYIFGKYFYQKRDSYAAKPWLEAYYTQFPQDIANLKRLVATYIETNDEENMKNFAAYLKTAMEQSKNQILSLAEYYKENFPKDAETLKQMAMTSTLR